MLGAPVCRADSEGLLRRGPLPHHPAGRAAMSAQQRVCNWAKGWAGQGPAPAIDVTWTNHEPASSLCQWYRANRTAANPPLPPTPTNATLMVCFELPMYAAVCAGAITAKQL